MTRFRASHSWRARELVDRVVVVAADVAEELADHRVAVARPGSAAPSARSSRVRGSTPPIGGSYSTSRGKPSSSWAAPAATSAAVRVAHEQRALAGVAHHGRHVLELALHAYPSPSVESPRPRRSIAITVKLGLEDAAAPRRSSSAPSRRRARARAAGPRRSPRRRSGPRPGWSHGGARAASLTAARAAQPRIPGGPTGLGPPRAHAGTPATNSSSYSTFGGTVSGWAYPRATSSRFRKRPSPSHTYARARP